MNNGKKFNTKNRKLRILVAPLDWGLGHTTRCIPIIREFQDQNCDVFIAAEGATEALLRSEFLNARFLSLRGYRIRYPRHANLKFWLLAQLPRLLLTSWRENRWLKKIIKEHNIDAIVSDNRFGLYNSQITSIYITHQLKIITGNRLTEKIAQKLHYYIIGKFNACWVPDQHEGGLGGELSHPEKMPQNVKYIGPLSRFDRIPGLQKKYDLLVTLSGPEPQRSIFEKMILKDLKSINGSILLVRGLPGSKKNISHDNAGVTIVNHLSAAELNLVMQQSHITISRSGYTTIMDLLKVGQKAILIPTPGQTEQEYLARYLQEKQIFMSAEQNKFSLCNALSELQNKDLHLPDIDMNQYKAVITEFVESMETEILQS